MATVKVNRLEVPPFVWPVGLAATSVWVLFGLSHFVTMCGIALSMFSIIKLHTLVEYIKNNERPAIADGLAWFVLWPGLNAKAFFRADLDAATVNGREALFAVAKTVFGALLFFVVSPRLLVTTRLGAGWVALLGVVFMLHFGSFHLLALWWRKRGRDVRPIMNVPILATSVSDFWGKRWNLAFRDYANPFLFRPLARKWSPTAAVLCGYVFSGVVHELAISVPAGGGFGLPTLYFALQGIAMLIERKFRSLSAGFRGWFWTLLVTAPGAFLLFHPWFVERVVVPLVEALA